MAKNFYDITLALAGICQAAHLVQQLAHHGKCDNDALTVSLNSLIDLNPPSTLAVYGHRVDGLRCGLQAMLAMLNSSSRQGHSAEITRYVLSLMVLERKLHGNPPALKTLAQRITQLERQQSHYGHESDAMAALMAAIYVDIISPLGPRIQVTGASAVLKNTLTQNNIRAVLLAGIRSAVLWQQSGGGRWQLMFSRNRLSQEAKRLLDTIPSAT